MLPKPGAPDLRAERRSGGAVTYADAYGAGPTNSTSSQADRYEYTGREYDKDTKLQYNGARFYDPAIEKWLSQDPIGFDGGDSNLYRYAGDGPTNATDPTGLLKQLEFQARGNGTIDIYQSDNAQFTTGEKLLSVLLLPFGYAFRRQAERLESPVLYIGYIDPKVSARVVWRSDVDGYVGLSTLLAAVNDESITNGKRWFQENSAGTSSTTLGNIAMRGGKNLFDPADVAAGNIPNMAEVLDRVNEVAIASCAANESFF